MIKIAVFASGSGSNAERLFQYFESYSKIQVTMLVSNKSEAGVWKRFETIPIQKILVSKSELSEESFLDKINDIDYIVLAGFLVLIPQRLISKFTNRIINVHPSLLPKYGGKGMYGSHVHNAVLDNNETETGITIHLVNEEYDKGKILAQFSCTINSHETIDSLSEKIHQLEFDYFPKTVEKYILEM